MKVFKIIFLLLVVVMTMSSQQIKWLDINGIQNCYVLGEGANGKIFAMNESALYSSTDNGENWSKILERGIMEEFVSKNNIAVIRRYISNVTDRHRIEMSTDNGETWSLIFADTRYEPYDNIMINDSGSVFACAYSDNMPARIVKYNGAKWDTIGTPITSGFSYVFDAAIDHLNNIYLLCRAQEGDYLYISRDYGNHWEKKVAVNTISRLYVGTGNIAIVAKNEAVLSNAVVYVSTNQGITWTYIGYLDGGVASFATDMEGRIYATTSEGIYINDDRSTTWKYLSPVAETFDDILVTKNGVILTTAGYCPSGWCFSYSGRSSTIYRTTDKGEFWSPSSVMNQDVCVLTKTRSGQIIVGTLGNRIFRSASGGVGWSQSQPDDVGDYVYSLALHNDNIYAGTDEGLVVSLDDGETWDNITIDAFSGSAYSVVINTYGDIIVGTNFGTYFSSDGGNNWISAGLTSSVVLFLTIDRNNKIYAVTDKEGVFASTDNAKSWQKCNLNRDDIQTINVNDAGDVFVGVYGGIMHSSDGGNSWAEHLFTNTYVYSIAFNSSQDIFAGSYNGVYMSRNNGLNWTFIGLNNLITLALDVDENQILYAGCYHQGVFRSEQSVTDVKSISNDIPKSCALYQNYPNPFNPTTKINFSLPERAQVSLKVFNVLGQEVATIVTETVMNAGNYEIEFNGTGLPSGLYFYRMTAGKYSQTRKMLLMK